eukprot:1160412-Pelagomonas_calceolata.AAC.6
MARRPDKPITACGSASTQRQHNKRHFHAQAQQALGGRSIIDTLQRQLHKRSASLAASWLMVSIYLLKAHGKLGCLMAHGKHRPPEGSWQAWTS